MKKLLFTFMCVIMSFNVTSQVNTWQDASKRTFLTENKFKKYYFKFVDDEYLKVIQKGDQWIDEGIYPDDFKIPILISLCYLEIYEKSDYETMSSLGIDTSEEWICLYRSWKYLSLAKSINKQSYYNFMISSRYDSIKRLVYQTSKNFNALVFLINEYDILKDQLFDLITIMNYVMEDDLNTQIKLMSFYTMIGDLSKRDSTYSNINIDESALGSDFFDEDSLEETTLTYFYISEQSGNEELNNSFIPKITQILPDSFYEIYSYQVKN